MLLQIKIYLIVILYFFGALFMVLFPPRNFERAGAKVRTIRNTAADVKFREYVDYEALLAITDILARNEAEVVRIVHLNPKTAENKSLIAIELRSDKQSKKPGILVIGGLNGMAWSIPNAIIELSEKLLFDTNYQTPLFNDYDWYLIPLANPDGLYFSQKIRSLVPIDPNKWLLNLTARNNTRPSEWHKNVHRESDQDVCFGTNVNRNFAYHWQDDVSKTPDRCSQYYPGNRPFSTAEAQAIRQYVHRQGENIHLAIHLHASFVPRKEYILYPWRYTLRQPSNYETLQQIGEYAGRQARLPHRRLYEVHQGSRDGRVAGTLSDYLAGVVGIELVFIVEPYHETFPNYTDSTVIDAYVTKAINAVSSIVRGWRKSMKQNTLSFFGRDIEF